jgi:deazaflavin-dependent oxidoreductase (nitroreductase family)
MAQHINKLSHPHGLGRLAFRLPILLYKIHLGWLLGNRFMLLTHVGRKSGLPRQTVIEVVHFDRQKRIFYAASGWGEKSDWYRNVMKNPHVSIQSGRVNQQAVAERLSGDEAGEELVGYAHAHPMAWRELASLMGYHLDGSESQIRTVGQTLPVFAFRLVPEDQA